MKEERIVPTGLKGYEISDRMKELMGMQPITENRKTSVVELTKIGPDGNVYGIVRENHEYYIKTTTKKNNLISEDFTYMGGLQNKKSEAYPSYAKAIKHLNLKFNSLAEAYDKGGNINVFQDDKLMTEDVAGFYNPSGPSFKNEGNMDGHAQSTCCGSPIMDGKCSECGSTSLKEDELTEVEQAIEDMREEADAPVKADVPVVENHKLSIGRAVNDMDSIIEGVIEGDKKKVYTLL
jgi:hypothetical protein